MGNEGFNDFVDGVTETANSICKDDGMLDRFMYTAVKRLMDRFGISAEEALEFWVNTAQEAFEFALNGESFRVILDYSKRLELSGSFLFRYL